MSESRLAKRLQEMRVPEADAAEDRAWRVVRAAHAGREPAPAPSPARRLVAALAAAMVVAAVALTPAGAKVADVVREVVGIDESDTKPALSPLPAAGEILVDSGGGTWLVRDDGSKRLLGGYGDPTFSQPRGLFVAATGGRRLVALEPTGEVRWSLTTPDDVRDVRWSPSGFRVAYRSGDELRVVAGDGTGDHVVDRDVAAVAPAWRPTAGSKLAASEPAEQVSYVDRAGRVRLVDAETGRNVPDVSPSPFPAEQHGGIAELAWSASGERLLSRSADALMSDDVVADGESGVFAYVAQGRARLVDAALAPNGDEVAVVERDSGVSTIRRFDLRRDERSPRGPVFAGPGKLAGLLWSPDGRWLATGWRDADQWLFIRSDRPRRLVAFDDVSAEFGDGSFPRLADWALPQR